LVDKTVGIIGGLGPEATVDFMKRVIAATPALDDADHIRMIVDSNPKVPSRIKAIVDETGESPAPALMEMARNLESYGADVLVIPCNAAHYYYDDISAVVKIPVLDMIGLTVDAIIRENPGIGSTGLLATDAVIKTTLYLKRFEQKGIALIVPVPERQERLMKSIRQIKTGAYGVDEKEALQSAAARLVERKAEALVIGCTELSIIWDPRDSGVSAFDSSQVLAEATVKTAKHLDPALL